MDADMRAVAGTIFGLREIAGFLAQERVAGALRGDRIKKIARINAGSIKVRDEFVFGKWLLFPDDDREGVRAYFFVRLFLDRPPVTARTEPVPAMASLPEKHVSSQDDYGWMK